MRITMHGSENVKLGAAGNIDVVFSMTFHCDVCTTERNKTIIHNPTAYQLLLLVSCFGIWKSRHQTIENIYCVAFELYLNYLS
jgi:hypothetical protein